MYTPPRLDRSPSPSHSAAVATWAIFGGLIVIGALVLPQAGAQVPGIGGVTAKDDGTGSGVYLPTDRSLSRAMARVRERLEDREYHQALTFLQDVLAREEDVFLERADGADEQSGLKATARWLIGELPSEGRDAYELLHAATARRQLESAVAAGNQDEVANVVRQFYHTSAGYEAALVLAQIEADHGHHLAAAQLYQELIDTPRAAAQFEPQLSLLAAVNQLAAGEAEAAAKLIRDLIARNPSATIHLAGQTNDVSRGQADPAAWLSDLVGKPLKSTAGEFNWLTARGNAARNARPGGGPPHLRARWEARVVNDPTVESFLSSRGEQLAERGAVAIPGARPIAVGDVVLMRTPQNVVAVDWHTGKRVWETREDEELEIDGLPSDYTSGIESEDFTSHGNALEQRIWSDALVASLASDGERAFIIRSPAISPQDEAMAWQVGPGIGALSTETSSSANQLAAYDLETQGKLLWELDGASSGGPLAGAFFLGAPVAIDNTLYVMAEIRSAVYLMALEPQTGKVRWQQQLIGLEQGISLDPARRLVGAAPSYAEGILVCPTSSGAVVAVDVVKRELAWVYRYPRQSPSPADMRQLWQHQVQNPNLRLSNRWRDSSAIVADGSVILTPPESAELHCVDLHTGKLNWKRRQGDALFTACVADGLVLLVGKEAVQAIRVEDNTPAWAEEFVALPAGALPAGQGYLSGDHYYLPVTTGGIAAIDLREGQLLPYTSDKRQPVLGNLICYRGSVLSQTALVLDKFEQSDVLQKRAEAALAVNPDDATALRELAEMRRVDGKTAEAVGLLKRAYQLSPDDPLTQEMLAEALLESLASDFETFRDDVPLVRRVLHGRAQEIELLRIEAVGFDKLGQRLAAFDAYLRLAEFTAETPSELRLNAEYTVRSDRWISGRLGGLWSAADARERAAIQSKLESRRPMPGKAATAAELRHYLSHFAALPEADSVRLEFARWLVGRRHAREAEVELLSLVASPDEEIQAAAQMLKSRLLAEKVSMKEGEWPAGRVTTKTNTIASAGRERTDNRAQPERQPGLRRLNIEQTAQPGAEDMQWFVAPDGSELVGRDGLGKDVFHVAVDGSSAVRQFGDNGFFQAAQLGHLLFVSFGGQVVAIDSRRVERATAGDVLWQAYPSARVPVAASGGRRGQAMRRANVYDVWSGRRRTSGSVVGSLGPVTPHGVVFQEQDELKCVDPLSGETFWAKSGMPTGCELLGDGELVFAADTGERVAYVFRMIDGELVEKRALPEFPWMLTAGRNVAQRDIRGMGGERKMHLRVTDLANDRVLFEAEYDDQAKMAVVEPQSIAVFEPSGKFQLVDVRTGEVRIDQQLEAVSEPQNIQTLVARDELFLMINTRSLVQQHRPIAPVDFPMVNGPVYAFSLKSGEPLWPGPALVRNRAIALSQPRDIPVLVFIDRKSTRDGNTGGGSQIRLLALDKRTGQTVYRNEGLPDTAATRFRIRAERDEAATVEVEMSSAEIHLTMTDKPHPPQPPANDELEIPRSGTERGLWGVAGRMSDVLQNALDKQSGKNRSRRAAQGQDIAVEPMDDD